MLTDTTFRHPVHRPAPAFTVLVVVYNHARYLDAALASVFAQSFQDFEVLAVDDGSVDGSRAILKRWRCTHPSRLRLLTHRNAVNRGLVETYALAMSQTRGDFVAFLEPDDAWSEHFLARKHDAFRTWPEAAVVFSPYRILREGRWGFEMVVRQWLLHCLTPRNAPFDNFGPLLRMNNVATFSSFAVRREFLAAVPACPCRRTMLLDWWVLLFLSAQGDFVLDVESHVVWRQRNDSALRRLDFHEMKKDVAAFYRSALATLTEGQVTLAGGRRAQLAREARMQPAFVAFLLAPSSRRFVTALKLNPLRAVALALSHRLNAAKYGRAPRLNESGFRRLTRVTRARWRT